MGLKKTDMERLKGASLNDRLSKTAPPARYGKESALTSRREQRKLDQAQGLVPFAVKLNQDLVRKIQVLAHERGAPLNGLVAELLEKGLAASGGESGS
jgi:hypothetical protein